MAYCGEGGTMSSLTDITKLEWKGLDPIYLGYSLEAAISGFEMVNDSQERQGAELVLMAEQIKKSQHNLNLTEPRQRAIIQTMADALIVLAKYSCIDAINPNAKLLFGLYGLKSPGRALIEFIQLEDDGELKGDVPAYHAKIN